MRQEKLQNLADSNAHSSRQEWANACLTPGFNLWKLNQGSFAFRVLDLTVFRFFVVKRKKLCPKKTEKFSRKKSEKNQNKKRPIFRKKDLDKNTGIKTPGAEILLLSSAFVLLKLRRAVNGRYQNVGYALLCSIVPSLFP